MVKYVIFFFMFIAVAHAQRRPTYAGSGNGLPVVLPQYLQGQQMTEEPVDNRLGSSAAVPVLESTSRQGNGQWIDIDQIKSWDEDRQPFWLKNWQQIQEHIGAPPSELPGIPKKFTSTS
ncbi:uncharacterized protein [Fopius arisanus]|uniref:Gnd protein n=1 Tax=Fopius arisanus TaxID=64838 RepID=A0A0C9PHZ7_9HYME|nr:PREDICTED: uncharacterized protein LOC105263763 [Fopius arisanus]